MVSMQTICTMIPTEAVREEGSNGPETHKMRESAAFPQDDLSLDVGFHSWTDLILWSGMHNQPNFEGWFASSGMGPDDPDVLFYYDGPIVFLATDASGNRWFVEMVGDDDDEGFNRYYLVSVSPDAKGTDIDLDSSRGIRWNMWFNKVPVWRIDWSFDPTNEKSDGILQPPRLVDPLGYGEWPDQELESLIRWRNNLWPTNPTD